MLRQWARETNARRTGLDQINGYERLVERHASANDVRSLGSNNPLVSDLKNSIEYQGK